MSSSIDNKNIENEILKPRIVMDRGLYLAMDSYEVSSILFKKGGFFSKAEVLNKNSSFSDFKKVVGRLVRSRDKQFLDKRYNLMLSSYESKKYWDEAMRIYNLIRRNSGID